MKAMFKKVVRVVVLFVFAAAGSSVFAQTVVPTVSMVTDNSYVYALDAAGTLHTLNVNSEGNFWFDSSLSLGSVGVELALDGNRLYAALGSDGFAIVDLTNPAEPAILATVPDSIVTSIAASGDNVFIGNNQKKTVTRVDVTDPQSPVVTGRYLNLRNVRELTLYSASDLLVGSLDGLMVLDITAQDTLLSVGHYSSRQVDLVSVQGTTGYATLCDGFETGFIVLDLSDLSSPSELAYDGTPSGQASYRNEYDFPQIVPYGNYVYLSFEYYGFYDTDSYGIKVMNVGDPGNPTLATEVELDTTAGGLTTVGTYLLAQYADSMKSFDLTDPANPTVLRTLDSPEQGALQPASPFLVKAWPNPFNPSLNVQVDLAKASTLRIELVDLLGRVVLEQHPGELNAGVHTFSVHPTGIASGTYFLKVNAGSINSVHKVIYLR